MLSIEITTACNARCIMCPRDMLRRKIQHMTPDVFDKIVSDCKNKPLKKINLFWFGDPLCNPDLIHYFEKIRKELPQVKVYISTNAELLNKDKADEIIKKGLVDVINFDIDGFKKETYESVRVGVSFDRVVENVRYFIGRRNELRFKKPQIRVTIIRMRETVNEIEDFKRYWTGHADRVDVNDFNTWLGTKDDRNTGKRLEESRKGSFRYPCIHPWTELVISADGIAGLCCLDYNLSARVGNVTEKSVEDIWRGEELTFYRQRMMNLEYEEIGCCRRCNAYIYQDDKLWARLWM